LSNIEKYTNKDNLQDKANGDKEEKENLSISVAKYLKLANGNPDVLEKLIKSSLKSIYDLRKEFITSVYDEKGEKLGQLIHKNTMSLHFLEAYRLNQLFKEFKKSLEQEDEGAPEKTKMAIIKELDSIIRYLKSLRAENLL